MKLKKAMALLLSLVMVLSLSACGDSKETSSDDSSSSDENVTISFSWWGGDTRHDAVLKAVEAFEEKYPNITVETNYGAWDGWEDKMSQAFSTGTASDVNQINWSWISSYSSTGDTFVNLNDYSDQIDLTQFDESYLEKCSVDDNLQAIPIAVTGRLFYWNKTTFENAGIEVPTTVEELLAAGQTFKEKLGDDYYPLCLGEYDRMILMVYYLESQYGKDWVTDGTLNYTTDEIKEGLEFIQSLEDNHVIPTLETWYGCGADSIDKSTQWIDGQFAGIFEWDSSASKYESALAEGQEFVVGSYLSDMGDYQGGYSKIALGYAVSSTCKHPKEAAMLINFLLNEEEGYSNIGGELGVPLSQVANTYCSENGLISDILTTANKTVMDWVSFSMDPKFEDATLKSEDGTYYDVFSGYSYGEYSADEAAKNLYTGITDTLSE